MGVNNFFNLFFRGLKFLRSQVSTAKLSFYRSRSSSDSSLRQNIVFKKPMVLTLVTLKGIVHPSIFPVKMFRVKRPQLLVTTNIKTINSSS